MATILWQKPDGSHAVTAVADGVDAEAHAAELAAHPPFSTFTLVGYDLPNPDPADPPRLTWAEFRDLFPPARQAALVAAAQANAALFVFMLDAASQGVDMGSERTAAGLGALVAGGLITEGERDLLLAGQPIPA